MFNVGHRTEEDSSIGRGTRRQKIAGFLRSANELRQSYVDSYMHSEDVDTEEYSIPGSFPNVKVSRNGSEEMVLFPSYARPHVRRTVDRPRPEMVGGDNLNHDPGDAEYWRREWEIHEDANAVVDVDVRGWIYTPARGALNRKNRLLMGVARKVSGIPAPGDNQPMSQSGSRDSSRIRNELRNHEEELVEEKALELAARGEREADVAGRGGYSEEPSRNQGRNSPAYPKPGDLSKPVTSSSLAESELSTLSTRTSWTKPADMSPEELAMANKHLITRLKPFMTTPAASMALTIFFYNDQKSQSRSTRTNESGHFNFRAALDFEPTHIRVLASESLSATEEVNVINSYGVSVISDIDDTIKHSGIGDGAREIFRNAFIRNLGDLTILGVNEWYWSMMRLGAKIHYVSNSPWQMYPVLNTYFYEAKLPPGSYHLKQYAGMLQGIFEPVAERKRGTIDRLFADFPERKFILIGDSGEADLEVYTETAMMYPKRVLGIFIRDVTTDPAKAAGDRPLHSSDPEKAFRDRPPQSTAAAEGHNPPPLPPRRIKEVAEEENLDIGDLIDFSEESEPEVLWKSSEATPEEQAGLGLPAALRPPPPSKPLALRSKSSENGVPRMDNAPPASSPLANPPELARKPVPPPPPKPRRLNSDPLEESDANSRGGNAASDAPGMPTSAPLPAVKQVPPPPPPPRRSGAGNTFDTLSASAPSRQQAPPPLPRRRNEPELTPGPVKSSTSSTFPANAKPAPPSAHTEPTSRHHCTYTEAAMQYANQKVWGGQPTGQPAETPQERRLELWHRRWERAQSLLLPKGIALRTWRTGQDVQRIAETLIRDEQSGREGKGEKDQNDARPHALRRV